MNIKKKIAIVTGGASGLGLSISTALANSDAYVVVFDRDANKLQILPDVFHKELLDVTHKDQVQAAVNSVINQYNRIDILVNNAGVIYNEPLINLTSSQRTHCYESYKKIIDINMNSVFLVSSMVAEQMILTRTAGVIVNISSISAEGNIGQSAYSAAKAGVNAFTKTWAKELGSFGIRVVAIAPGFIDTPSTKEAINPAITQEITKKIPLKKLGNLADVAHAVMAVINNQYINGTVIHVHGGLVL